MARTIDTWGQSLDSGFAAVPIRTAVDMRQIIKPGTTNIRSIGDVNEVTECNELRLPHRTRGLMIPILCLFLFGCDGVNRPVVDCIHWSHDGQMLVVGSHQFPGRSVQRGEVESRVVLVHLGPRAETELLYTETVAGPVAASWSRTSFAQFRPDHSGIALGGLDGKVVLLELPGQARTLFAEMCSPTVSVVAFSDDGETLVVAARFDIAVCNLTNDTVLHIHSVVGRPRGICLSPEGDVLAVAGLDDAALYDARDGSLRLCLQRDGGMPYESVDIGFVGGKDELILACIDEVVQLNVHTREEVQLLDRPNILAMSIAPDEKLLAVAHASGVLLFDLSARKTVREIAHPGARSVALSGDAQALAVGDDRGAVVIYDPTTGEKRESPSLHPGRR